MVNWHGLAYISIFTKVCHRKPWISLRGHSRSYIWTQYVVYDCRQSLNSNFRFILPHFRAINTFMLWTHFSIAHSYSTWNLWMFHLRRLIILEAAKSEDPSLTFALSCPFQRYYMIALEVTKTIGHNTSPSQMDWQLAMAICAVCSIAR